MTIRTVPTPDDISACDREPIHIPGSIQPHGLLLALDPADRTLVQTSANVSALIGEVLGQPLDTAWPQLAEALSTAPDTDAEAVCEHLLSELAYGALDDDVALLVVRVLDPVPGTQTET